MEPRDYAERAERARPNFDAKLEHFAGWGIMGLPFASGHILAIRRFPAVSIGPGYTSVWHRDPGGAWTFYANIEPLQSCNRYFGSAVERFVPAKIEVTWEGPRFLTVRIPEAKLDWSSHFAPTAVTRAMNAIGAAMPEAMWRNNLVLDAMSRVAGRALRAGTLRMRGQVPNHQSFIANPRTIFTIPRATASLQGEDFGRLGPVPEQAWLGDFAIPQRGLLAFGHAFFEPFDHARHLVMASRA